MRFVCLGYSDPVLWSKLTDAERRELRAACKEYSEELRQGGHLCSLFALKEPGMRATLRRQHGRLAVTDGPFAETKEVLGGFLILEARDLNHAIALLAQHPGTRLGPMVVSPLDESSCLRPPTATDDDRGGSVKG